MAREAINEAVQINLGAAVVDADLHVPDRAAGFVIFAHGSGSSRFGALQQVAKLAAECRQHLETGLETRA